MRIGPALFLLVALAASPEPAPAGPEEGGDAGQGRASRGPYLLRRIFGDLPQSTPAIWGVAPGVRHGDLPPGADLGDEVKSPGSPPTFLKEVSGSATVTFVFDGTGDGARLHHISVTLTGAPSITPRTVLAYLAKIYGAADPSPPGDPQEILGSWQGGSILLRHFPAARFFEVTLAAPRLPPVPSP